MSGDPRINSALFNFCIAADDGPRADRIDPNRPRASLEDLRWLKEAMQSVEMPDRAMKRCVTTVGDWFVPMRDKLRPASQTAAAAAPAASSSASPPLMLGASSQLRDAHQELKPDAASTNSNTSNITKAIKLDDLADATDEVMDALEEICEMAEDLNYAKEFMLLKGAQLYLDILRLAYEAAAAVSTTTNSSNNNDNSKKAKQWSNIRTLLLRSLSGASANFEEFQNELCKFGWARVIVPQLSAIRAVAQPFPNEAAALLICITNVVRAHGPALQQFLQNDGMFHLANALDFFASAAVTNFSCVSRTKSANADGTPPLEQQEQKYASRAAWINGLRRSFNCARYLVEEHGVTSQRVLCIAADVVAKVSVELLSSSVTDAARDASEDLSSSSQYSEEDFTRDKENMCTGAGFAALTLAFSIARTADVISKKNKSNNNAAPSSVEELMPVWGKHITGRLSGEWWQLFAKKCRDAARIEGDADAAAALVVPHHDLSVGVVELVKQLDVLRAVVPALQEKFD